ncbi:MAG TPA: PIN domain-containing protein [Terriglobales bacterium]|nr:PIN domain-containing protein [Terriglobales bacterium]
MSLAFFDTNILIYADDTSAATKQAKADGLFREHFERGTALLSLQVLQEYYSAVTRKLGTDPQAAQRRVEILASSNVVRFQARDVIAAIEFHRLTQVSFWDAMIVHAARIGGASVLYSEDLQHGAIMGGVKVLNPFRT